MAEREGTMIICLAGPLDGKEVEGTSEDICFRCGTTVRVAPSSREWARSAPPPVELICNTCGIELLRKTGAPLNEMPGQAEELHRHFRRLRKITRSRDA